jgi:hypothetical protein
VSYTQGSTRQYSQLIRESISRIWLTTLSNTQFKEACD